VRPEAPFAPVVLECIPRPLQALVTTFVRLVTPPPLGRVVVSKPGADFVAGPLDQPAILPLVAAVAIVLSTSSTVAHVVVPHTIPVAVVVKSVSHVTSA
jgi:hypothetical protein